MASFDLQSQSTTRETSPLSEIDSSKEVTLLAASAQITETTYSVSDIQTRIFEIQELRHQDLGPPSESPSVKSISVVIDDALIGLDQRLQSVAHNISLISSTLEPLSQQLEALPQSRVSDLSTVVFRKHDTLLGEWESVQHEAASLREELKEDKWLLVFRNASDQADGMMNSLERIVDQCSRYAEQFRSTQLFVQMKTNASEKAKFDELQKSLVAKEKYYVPSVSKVLSVLDKGVKIRATKNGESLRRHADMRARWKALQLKISNTDSLMETIKALYADRSQPDHDERGARPDDRAISSSHTPAPPSQHRTARPSSRLSGGAPGPKPHVSPSPYRTISRRSSSQQLHTPLSIPKADSKPPTFSVSPRSVSQGAVRPTSRLSHPRSYSSAAVRRPMSPSQIPAPKLGSRTSYDDEDDDDDDVSILPRAITPSFSVFSSPPGSTPHAKRQSLLPLPRRDSRAPSPSQAHSVISHNTSVFSTRNKDTSTPSRPPRSSARSNEAGPSSFTLVSRPSSRLSAVSSNMPPFPYSPNTKDPLDVEIAFLINTVKHPFQVERVDPHIRHPPALGDEMKAQYAFTSRLGRKVLACKLLIIHRAAPKTIAGHIPTRKVMCRIGGGWQDLESFLLGHT